MIIRNYLEKNVIYSFAKNYEGEDDPTAAFLFGEDKRGYCVHIAHAATYLLRAMGVPARVSAGYAVPASQLGEGSSLLIKQNDAHAWTEIYLDKVGWIPIEVTPERSDVQQEQFRDKDLQQLLGEMARKQGRTSSQRAQPSQLFKALKALLSMVPYALLLMLAAAYLTKLWRVVAPAFAPSPRQSRVSYRAALDRLSAVGFSRGTGESRELFASRAGSLAPSFGPLTSVHLERALGWKRGDAKVAELPGLARGVAKEVRRAVPWWRWLLGALNPVSWIWSK
jgi:hypothetical protein